MYTIEHDNKTINMVNDWTEITIGQFNELQQILSADIPEDYRTLNCISLLTNESTEFIGSLPLTKFQILCNQLNFITLTIPKVKHKTLYIINGRKYNLRCDVSQISTAQYIDYQSYIKENDIIKLLSLWLIPEGHSYNDGYDIQRVMMDCNDMLFIDANAVGFFLRLQLAAYILILKDSSKKKMKKTKRSKKEITEMETHYNNMVSCLLY